VTHICNTQRQSERDRDRERETGSADWAESVLDSSQHDANLVPISAILSAPQLAAYTWTVSSVMAVVEGKPPRETPGAENALTKSAVDTATPEESGQMVKSTVI
jgi:hypothetical protein